MVRRPVRPGGRPHHRRHFSPGEAAHSGGGHGPVDGRGDPGPRLCRRTGRRRDPQTPPNPPAGGGRRRTPLRIAAGGSGSRPTAPSLRRKTDPPGSGGLSGDRDYHHRPQRGHQEPSAPVQCRMDRPAVCQPGGYVGSHQPPGRPDGGDRASGRGRVPAAAEPAAGGYGPPGHWLQGIYRRAGRHNLCGPGYRGSETPFPAIRQAAIDLAPAKRGHPLDILGKRAEFCSGPPAFDRNPIRRRRMLSTGRPDRPLPGGRYIGIS